MFGLFKKEKIMVEHYSCSFITIDGKEHIFNRCPYLDTSHLVCLPANFIMIDVISRGYLEDNDGIMYPLTNIISIKWDKDDEKEIVKESPYLQFYY